MHKIYLCPFSHFDINSLKLNNNRLSTFPLNNNTMYNNEESKSRKLDIGSTQDVNVS